MSFKHVEHVMGTAFSIEVRDPTVDASVLPPVLRRLHQLDAMFSTYRPDSVISRLNRNELRPAEAPADIRFVLEQCEQWRRRTGGRFDVRFAGALDPSGYVKGWAIAQASALLQEAGSSWHSVNGGGDITAIGSAADRPWNFGIVDPREPGRLIGTATGHTLAVATSGIAERGAHLYDPLQGSPADHDLLSLTIVGRDIVACDVLATAGFAGGPSALDWLAESYSQLQVFGCRSDGTIITRPAATDRTNANSVVG